MPTVLFIGKVWPEPASSAAGARMMHLLKLFQERHFRVIFSSPALATEFSEHLDPFIETRAIAVNDSSFDVMLQEIQPDVVIFDRFTSEEQFGWRVAQHCPQAVRVLDTEDLHCLRQARHDALKKNLPFNNKMLMNEVARREIASIYRCDLSLIISSFEMQLLVEYFDVKPFLLHYLPFYTEAPVEDSPDFSARKNFVTIGNFLHAPNTDAVQYTKSQLWPGIRKKLPGVQMLVYGSYANDQIKKMHDPHNGFLIMGRAPETKAVMRTARVCLAPLRFGAGLKGKLLDAMRDGTPSVTTPIGAEGMHHNETWCGEIGNTAEELIEAAVRLYTSEQQWNQARQQGYRLLRDHFNQPQHGRDLIQKTKEISDNIETHRSKNFTGAMLMHHFSMAYKYLALWIEAKNKNETTDK